jgi:hypothetical protein
LALPDTLAPVAVPAPSHPDSLASQSVVGPRAYGFTPRGYRILPGGAIATEGRFATLALSSADPVGRLSWLLEGALGDRKSWRGASLSAAWRGWPVELDGQLFGTWDNGTEYHGLAFSAALPAADSWHTDTYRLGFSAGRLGGSQRTFAFAKVATNADATNDDHIFGWGSALNAAGGRTDGGNWARLLADVSAHVGTRDVAAQGSFAAGLVSHGAPAYEQFELGGIEPPLTDSSLLTQRLADPVLPVGLASGQYLLHYRFATAGVIPVSLFFDGTAAGNALHIWHRLYGAELRYTIPPLGFVRLPGIDATTGVGYSIDDPFKYKLRGYLIIRYAP